MGHNTKNYRLQGGERIVIGGEVVLAAEAVIDDQRPCPILYTPPSTASTIANAVKDFNALVASLKAAQIIEPVEPTLEVAELPEEVLGVVDEEVVLEVKAHASDGRPLNYQWYANTTASVEGGTAIDGATDPVYAPSTAEVGVQHYYCIVSEQSDAATLVFEPTACGPTTVTVSAE